MANAQHVVRVIIIITQAVATPEVSTCFLALLLLILPQGLLSGP